MNSVLNCACKITLEPQQFARIIANLNNKGWRSLHWQSQLTILSLADIGLDDKSIHWICFNGHHGDRRFRFEADVFVQGQHLFYLKVVRTAYYDGIEAGVITNSSISVLTLLSGFTRAFIDALKEEIDGRTYRHWDLKWLRTTASMRTDAFRAKVGYHLPATNVEKIAAAVCLVNPAHRALLQQFLKNRKQSLPDASPAHLSALLNARLLSVTNNTNQYIPTDLAKTMIKSSHWMTVWLTQQLMQQGIPEKDVIWGLTEDGEEVDLVVLMLEKVIFFELKDGDFEAGHAQRFHHRKVKFNADKLAILVTGRVSDPAKKVFADFDPKDSAHPIYIEGLDKVNDALPKLLHNTVMAMINEKCKELDKVMDTSLHLFFKKLFGEPFHEWKGAFVQKGTERMF